MDKEFYEDPGSVLTMRDHIQVLFRQKMVILTCILTVAITAFIGLKMKTKMYESRVKMLITAVKQVESPYYREVHTGQRSLETLTQSEIVKSDPVVMRVVMSHALHKRPLDDEKRFASPLRQRAIDLQASMLLKHLKKMSAAQQETFMIRRAKEILKMSTRVEPIRDTNMFTITVRDYDPIGCAVLANTISRAYVIYDLEQQLAELLLKYGDKHPKVVHMKDNIAKMSETLSGAPLSDLDAMGPASVKIIEQASVPLEPSGQSKKLVFLLAFVMSVFLGVMLAFIFEYADQSLKSPRDLEKALEIPYFGSVRKKGWLGRDVLKFTGKRPSLYERSYQQLCDYLYIYLRDKGVKSLMLASTVQTEGALIALVNIANYISRYLKHRVLVIDADFRDPQLHKVYKLKQEGASLSGHLQGKNEIDDVVVRIDDGLAIVVAGQTDVNPMVLLESGKMKEFLSKMQAQYDLVLVRSATLRDHKDPGFLAEVVDGVMVVVQEGNARRQVIQNSLSLVKGRAKCMLGTLLVDRTYPIPQWLYDKV